MKWGIGDMQRKLMKYSAEILLVLIGVTVLHLSLIANLHLFKSVETIVKNSIIDQAHLALNVAVDNIEKIYQKYLAGDINEQTAQRLVREYVETSFFGPENLDYFWILSTDGVLIAHPYEKEYVGLHYMKVDDEILRTAAESILKAARSGMRYAEYSFYKYGSRETESKISAITIFEPWGWIVGTGFYRTSILEQVKKARKEVQKSFYLVFAIILVIYSSFVFQYIKNNVERTKMLKQLSFERDILKKLINSIPEPVALFGRSKQIEVYNQSYERLVWEVGDLSQNILAELSKAAEEFNKELTVKTSSGTRWFRLEIKRISDYENTYEGSIVVMHDITDQKLQILFWQDKAYQDPLTGVANRNLLDNFIEKFPDLGDNFSIIMLDLDNFKQLNDEYGHPFGDEVLKAFTKILRNSIRKDEFLIRYGGDEFLIITKQGKSAAISIVERLQERLDQPLEVEGKNIKITFSSGISNSLEDGNKILELIKIADERLYEAKKSRNKNNKSTNQY